ncbi:MAG: preprotein translocase subunit SecA [bacterium]|nr:preprotein translocase subunit SecA [bacterium]
MFGKLFEAIFGSKHTRDIQRLTPIVETINRLGPPLRQLSDEQLRAKTDEFRAAIAGKVGSIRDSIRDLHGRLTAVRGEGEGEIDFYEIRKQIEALEKEEFEKTQEVLAEILPEAFAVVRETCRRLVGKSWKVVGRDVVWDMVPFDVQLLGGIVLHEGKIAEMGTGEGKTLVATMPLYLNALVGKGAHLVTVNDYLARRDCEWMGEIFKFLGLTVDYITNDMEPESRRRAYRADITYGTNNEFGFDYLRDNMSISPETVVQRGHYFAIIDEVDSVLIDEARTPLIISGPVGESTNKYAEMKPRVEQLVKSQTVLANGLLAEAERLLAEGKEYEAGIKLLQAQRGAPVNKRLVKLKHEPGTQKLIRRVEADYMRDRRMPEIDAELYFAIDEKAHTIDLTDKGRESLSPGNPAMFVVPDLATELSKIDEDGTLSESEKALRKDAVQNEYIEKSERLHNISQLLRAYSLFEKDVDYVVSEDQKVMIVDEFTGRLMPGRRYSDGLHQALEAKEGVTIERETQTLATITLQNFFRLYRKLAGMTGTAETEAGEFWEIYKLDVVVIPTNEPIRRKDFDDVVYRTKREKYNAIIDEIAEIHGQGLPVLVGTISVEVSETLSRMLKRRGIRHSVLNAKYHKQEAEIVSMAGEPGMVTIATNMAGRGTDIKLGRGVIVFPEEGIAEMVQKAATLQSRGRTVFIHELPAENAADVSKKLAERGIRVRTPESAAEKQALLGGETAADGAVVVIPRELAAPADSRTVREGVEHIKARDFGDGGLQILGTERHDARRIDRQLRGRSGRQGDPGATRFYLSLEDELMRLFGSERIAGVMDRLGVEEGEVITHPMITRSIGRAQKRVEMRNFDIRKHLLEYDDVMNKQREVIYKRRNRALEGENLQEDIIEMIEDTAAQIVDDRAEEARDAGWDLAGLREALVKSMLLTLPQTDSELAGLKPEEMVSTVTAAAVKAYKRKREMVGPEMIAQLERFATLKTIDERWKEHLYEMDLLKEGIGLRAYGQKDPLIEYKQEGFRMFTDMLGQINREIVETVFKAQIRVEQPMLEYAPRRRPAEMAMVHAESTGMGFAGVPGPGGGGEAPQGLPPGVQPGRTRPVRVEKAPGRNDPCPCGSGKKYKHCHGA